MSKSTPSAPQQQNANQELPAVQYNDMMVVSVVTAKLPALGGFAPNSKYLLRNRQNGVVTAFSDPLNSGRRLAAPGYEDVVSASIDYMFDKNSRPINVVEQEIGQLLTSGNDAIVGLARHSELSSVRDMVAADETGVSLRQKLQTRQQVLQQAHRDVFDEVMPAMQDGNDTARIVFPYNTMGGGHWVTAEINMTRTRNPAGQYQYTINMAAHDPLGGGSIGGSDAQKLADVVTRRIAEEHNRRYPAAQNQVNAANFQVTSARSPYRDMIRQHDGNACGAISAEEMLRRLGNQDIQNINYPPNAMALRQSHIQTMQQQYGENSLITRGFRQEYQSAIEAQKKKQAEKSSASPMELTSGILGEDLSEALLVQQLYDLERSLAVRMESQGKSDSASKEKDASKQTAHPADDFGKELKTNAQFANASKAEKTDTKPTSAQKGDKEKPKDKPLSADEIFSKDKKVMAAQIGTVAKKGFVHRGDPTMQGFKTQEECIENATKHVDSWRKQVTQLRDTSFRVLMDSITKQPETRGQPKNYTEEAPARPIQEMSALLHNLVHAQETGKWEPVKETPELNKKNKSYGPTTVCVGVVRESPSSLPVILVAEAGNGKISSVFRRNGIEMSGAQAVDVSDAWIGPWKMPPRSPNRDKAEAYPGEGRIPVLSNVTFNSKETRHAEANLIAHMYSRADTMLRDEMLKSGAIPKWDTPIDVKLVNERVRGMMLDISTDKPHCPECGKMMEAVLGKEFNSGTTRGTELFENWREPFPGAQEATGAENPYRDLKGKIKSDFTSQGTESAKVTKSKGGKSKKKQEEEGQEKGEKNDKQFNVNDRKKFSDTPGSPTRFYEDELQQLAQAAQPAWRVQVNYEMGVDQPVKKMELQEKSKDNPEKSGSKGVNDDAPGSGKAKQQSGAEQSKSGSKDASKGNPDGSKPMKIDSSNPVDPEVLKEAAKLGEKLNSGGAKGKRKSTATQEAEDHSQEKDRTKFSGTGNAPTPAKKSVPVATEIPSDVIRGLSQVQHSTGSGTSHRPPPQKQSDGTEHMK